MDRLGKLSVIALTDGEIEADLNISLNLSTEVDDMVEHFNLILKVLGFQTTLEQHFGWSENGDTN